MANEIQLTQDQLAQFELIRLTTENSTLLEGLAQLNHQFAIEDGQQAPPMPFQEWIAARLDDEAMYIALVLEDGIPIGYVLIFDVMTHPFIPDWQRTGYITQLFVHANHRRKGVGQQLVDNGLAWLTQRGVPQVMLNVHADNPTGEQFWDSMGFLSYLLRKVRKLSSTS